MTRETLTDGKVIPELDRERSFVSAVQEPNHKGGDGEEDPKRHN